MTDDIASSSTTAVENTAQLSPQIQEQLKIQAMAMLNAQMSQVKLQIKPF
jgi:hypothetical protein